MRSLSLCFLLAALSVPASNSVAAEINVGGASMRMPAPQGMYEISERSPETRRLLETLVSRGHRLLLVYVTRGDYEAVSRGEGPGLERYVSVQANRQLENRTLHRDDFRQLRALLRKKQETLLDEVHDDAQAELDRSADSISRESGVDAEIRIGNNIPLGVFMESENYIGFAHIIDYQASADGREVSSRIVGATTVMRVRDRLLFAYVYSTYESDADVQWVQSLSKRWVRRLLAVNR